MEPLEAALRGGAEVSFTVLSMSLSLIAVFLPILLMPGLIGRLFQEFAETLSITILISLLVSLTTTPMLCALLLRREAGSQTPHRLLQRLEDGFELLLRFYERTLRWALAHARLVGIGFLLTIVLNVALFVIVPKGFFPEQDNGLIIGTIQADQGISFDLMKQKVLQLQTLVQHDPAVASVASYTGGRSTNSGFLFITLKPLAQRHSSATAVVARLRRPLARIPGAQTFLVPAQDLRVGGRQSNAEYQYTLQSDDAGALAIWVPKIVAALKTQHSLADVNSDLQNGGLETNVVINRPQASRLNITPSEIDNTLYDAFGQRNVSTIYNELNQYEVVMELAPDYQQTPVDLSRLYISTSGGSASGTSQTNAPAGTVVIRALRAWPRRSATVQQHRRTRGGGGARFRDQPGGQLDRRQRQVQRLQRHRGQHQCRDHGAALGHRLLPARHHADLGQPSERADRGHHLVQPAGRCCAWHRGGDDSAHHEQSRRTADHHRQLRGHRGGVPVLAIDRATADPGSARGGVYRARHSLRKHVHPLTILSTIPSAGVGATLFLLMLNTPSPSWP